MADYDAPGSGTGISGLDGTNESITKSKPKPKRACSVPDCLKKTSAADGICANCKAGNKTNTENGDNKKEKKGKKKPSKTKPVFETTLRDPAQENTDEIEQDDRRRFSTLVTPEPFAASNEFDDVIDILSSPSPFVDTPGRGSISFRPGLSASPHPSITMPLTPATFNTEASYQQEPGSPSPVSNYSSYIRPTIEIPISTSHKRNLDEAELSPLETGKGDIHHEEAPHKHRKITSVSLPATNAATEADAIKAFQDAMAVEAQAQEDQLAELKRAQQEQLEAMEAARITQTDSRKTDSNAFIASFKILQDSRDYFESEMLSWKDKYSRLEDVLKTTAAERDNWMIANAQLKGEKADMEKELNVWKEAKMQVDEEKAEVEKVRDEWKEAKEKVDEEKAAVEQAKRDADAANAEEVSMLKDKLGKVKKRKAELAKMMAGDSD